MLREPAQMAAQILDVHPAAVRGAADVNDLCARKEEDTPACPAKSRHPVDLFAEHEEVLVEEADRVGGLAPHEERRPVQPVDFLDALVREVAAVQRVEETRVRGELPNEEILGREPPQR